jgi:hypothetical protein
LFCFPHWQSLSWEMQKAILLGSAFGGEEYEKLVKEAVDYVGREGDGSMVGDREGRRFFVTHEVEFKRVEGSVPFEFKNPPREGVHEFREGESEVKEYLRFKPSGEVVVRGVTAEDDHHVYDAFTAWMRMVEAEVARGLGERDEGDRLLEEFVVLVGAGGHDGGAHMCGGCQLVERAKAYLKSRDARNSVSP